MSDEKTSMMTSAAASFQENGELPGTVIVYCTQSSGALEIRDALLSDAKLAGAILSIEVRDNHAIVSGTVQTEAQRKVALSTAGRYVGRDRVTDEIEQAK